LAAVNSIVIWWDGKNRGTSPNIHAKKVKLADQHNQFAGKAAGLGLMNKKDADLDSYVTQKAMDGLFAMIAEHEKAIRSDPLQAGSALLKKVFGAM
jgi:hypothetical protein